jgi:rhodanese-related sulfurtransferase
MKKYILTALVSVFVLASQAHALNFISAEDFKKWLDSGKSIIIIDIQPADEYEKQHFRGSIETNASPARTDEEKKRLDAVIPGIKASKVDVVIVRPGGRNGRRGSYNTFNYLQTKGVPEKRLYILEGGIVSWPYENMFIKGR